MTEPGTKRSPAGERVWRAACELFSRDGIRAVGVAEIAETSGVGKPNLYRNFGSKDDLAVAYLRAQAEAGLESFEAARQAFPDDHLAQLRQVIARVAAEMGTPGYRGCVVANAAIEFPDRAHPVRAAVDELKAEYLRRLTELVAHLPVDDPEGLAYALQVLLEGASATAQFLSVEKSRAVLIETTERVIASHLRR
ncbi:TetR/AcrR family transcriptional regulator [Goodfellowiella coeruleoviolacea]|uniref:Transcriptional regulator, TetR family n=1 Tax=Goodfellowiella coeruleoviolacea TaxID=334858 RepID=A0AAE3KE07_9PSEU|nr:TetR/AcrR family transcriptional regulator [Goodfellowiella coeruleoviolacea]MCP2163387.1 transcriptional regulator, TetR family [Goodfellowiella coeruleoviolacea]